MVLRYILSLCCPFLLGPCTDCCGWCEEINKWRGLLYDVRVDVGAWVDVTQDGITSVRLVVGYDLLGSLARVYGAQV